MYKFNGSVPEGMNSLHCELELAQSSEVQIKNPIDCYSSCLASVNEKQRFFPADC